MSTPHLGDISGADRYALLMALAVACDIAATELVPDYARDVIEACRLRDSWRELMDRFEWEREPS